MAHARRTGWSLTAARVLAESPLRGLVWRAVRGDFGLGALDALPAEARDRVEELPRPLAGAPPRAWGEGDLGPPVPVEGTGADLRARYAAGTLSPSAALEHVLERIDARSFGASGASPFVALDREGARAAAAASDRRWAEGRPLGPLDGVLVPIKDEFHQAGLPTRGGTAWRTQLEGQDAWVTARLRAAGAVLLGKTHATENGMNPLGTSDHHAMPRNVWSPEHGAGGSSTGSAVAVGLGMAPVALATDGGGSIRVPAALNGLFGLKPSFTRIGRSGGIWLGSLGTAGPIGRSTADLVDLLEVCAAPDPGDPLTQLAPDWAQVVSTWRPALGRGIRGCRIGVLRAELAEATTVIARACEAALKGLAAEGAVLVDLDLPLLRVANAVGPLVIASESAANAWDDQQLHRTQTSEELRLIYGLMNCVTAQDLLRASRVRSRLRLDLAAALAGVDLLALPVTPQLAPRYAPGEGPLVDTAATAAMTRFNFAANLTGLPAGSAPVGFADGLPIGLQLVGDAWDEASVIAGLAHLERAGIATAAQAPSFRCAP